MLLGFEGSSQTESLMTLYSFPRGMHSCIRSYPEASCSRWAWTTWWIRKKNICLPSCELKSWNSHTIFVLMESLGPAGLLSGALPTHYTAGLKINCVHGRRSLGLRWLLVMDP